MLTKDTTTRDTTSRDSTIAPTPRWKEKKSPVDAAKRAVKSVGKSIGEWAKHKEGPVAPIPTPMPPKDAEGNPTHEGTMYDPDKVWVRSGVSDWRSRLATQQGTANPPELGAPDENGNRLVEHSNRAPEPTPIRDRLMPLMTAMGPAALTPLTVAQAAGARNDHDVEPWMSGFVSPVATAADVVNDVNTRVAMLRPWMADDPRTEADDPVYKYTTPKGNSFTEKDKQHFWTIPNANGGTRLVDDDYLRLIGKDHPDYIAAKLHHSQFPDGTMIRDADGRETKESKDTFQEQIGKGEIGEDGKTPTQPNSLNAYIGNTKLPIGNFLNLGIAEPRSPLQDKAGHNAYSFDGTWGIPGMPGVLPRINPDYDIRQSAIDEIVPWLIDQHSSSLPYYGPPVYAATSAAANAIPYLSGYDGNSYTPEAPGFEQLDRIGLGRYEKNELTNAQRASGFVTPFVEQMVEKWNGEAVGGLPNWMKEGRFADLIKPVTGSKAGRIGLEVVGSGISEGQEEGWTSWSNQLTQEGPENFGKDKYWDDVNKQVRYEPTPLSKRIGNVLTGTADAIASGAMLGISSSGPKQVIQGIKRGNTPDDYEPKVNPRVVQPTKPRPSEAMKSDAASPDDADKPRYTRVR